MITREFNVMGVPVTLAASGAWPIRYHKITGRDGILDMQKIADASKDGNIDMQILYDVVYTLGTLAGFKGDEEAFFGALPSAFNIFELFTQASTLIREDGQVSKG